MFLLSIPFFLDNVEAASAGRAEKQSFQDRFRQKILRGLSGQTTRTSSDLPGIGIPSDTRTESLSPFSSATSSFSSEFRVPSVPQSTRVRSSTPNSRGKFGDRRPGIISGSRSFDSGDQDEIAQAFSYVSKIQDERIQNQALVAVRAAKRPRDKIEIALLWLHYLSKIENEADRCQAESAVQFARTEDKQSEARIWLNYLTKIPAGPTRNAAIADMRDEELQKNRELVAKIWENYLSKIEEETMQKQAASAVRRASHVTKERLAQEWLRVSVMNPTFLVAASPAERKIKTWFQILSQISNSSIRNEARPYIEEIPGGAEKILMARLWVDYLSQISEKSKRVAAINEILQASSNRWEDIASEHYLQYRLLREES